MSKLKGGVRGKITKFKIFKIDKNSMKTDTNLIKIAHFCGPSTKKLLQMPHADYINRMLLIKINHEPR